jgi:putative ABC transport system ATP-binding protein
VLAVRDLVKHYPAVGGEPVRAVDSVSLQVDAGEMVALYGPSGSGKTTLLLMLATLLTPTSGEISIGEREVSSLSEREATLPRTRACGFLKTTSSQIGSVGSVRARHGL